MKKSNIITAVIVAVIVVMIISYFYYSGNSAPAGSAGLVQSQNNQSISAVGGQELSLLNQIRSLRIDSSLFSDPGYQTLRDYSVDIPSQTVGRQDPFAPIPGVSTAETQTSPTGH